VSEAEQPTRVDSHSPELQPVIEISIRLGMLLLIAVRRLGTLRYGRCGEARFETRVQLTQTPKSGAATN
jgi:hypothetical protein